jgi:hypothetical protein
MRFRHLLLLLCLLLAACAAPPKTAQDSFARCRVVIQPDGKYLVVGPELPFTARGARGVTKFQALVAGERVRYYQKTSIGMAEDVGTFEVSRPKMEQFRGRGALLAVRDTGVAVRFSPAYVDGFLRRVDEVARQR